ncbi:MAG: YraN family protein [Chloroflexota bacterium]|mgnify:CR=1 FL=1
MAAGRKTLGEFGEAVAAAYLARNGHRIVARRWRCSYGEIDLVTQDGPELVFVEVRARRAAAPGAAEESIGPHKRSRLARLAYSYLEAMECGGTPWRIDVVAVDIDRGGRVARLTHIPSAVEEG